MRENFVEFTVVVDSSDSLARPRKGSFAPSQIVGFIDIDNQGPAERALTKITLLESDDYINTDDEIGGVVRASRTLYVQEAYEEVKAILSRAS